MRLRLLVATAAATTLPLMLGGVAASASSTVHAVPARTAPVTGTIQAAPVASAIAVHLAVHGLQVSSLVLAAARPVRTVGPQNAPVPADCFDTWVVSASGTRSYLSVGTHGDLADMETYATCFTADLIQPSGYGGFNWWLVSGNGGCLQFDTSNNTVTNESCDSEESVELWAHPDEGNGTSFWINQWAYENQNYPYYALGDPLSSCGTPAQARLTGPGTEVPACSYYWYNN
jgi:hypothetical protein